MKCALRLCNTYTACLVYLYFHIHFMGYGNKKSSRINYNQDFTALDFICILPSVSRVYNDKFYDSSYIHHSCSANNSAELETFFFLINGSCHGLSDQSHTPENLSIHSCVCNTTISNNYHYTLSKYYLCNPNSKAVSKY